MDHVKNEETAGGIFEGGFLQREVKFNSSNSKRVCKVATCIGDGISGPMAYSTGNGTPNTREMTTLLLASC